VILGSVDGFQAFVGGTKAFAIAKDGGVFTGSGSSAGITRYGQRGARVLSKNRGDQ
jgi:hypothetical protein